MLKKRPVFYYSACAACKICAQACPISCISMTKPGKQGKYRNVFPIVTGECIGCGTCERACPMGCITMEETGL